MSDGPPGGPSPPPPGQPGQPGWGQSPPPSGQPPGEPPPGWGQQPPPQYYGPYAQPPKNEGNAITVLVLSIVSWVVCPIIPAIIALAMAPTARRNIAQSGGTLTGETLVKAGVIVSWVNIGFYVLCGFALLLLIAIGASADSNDTLGALLPALS